ncbi:MAG: hypothetical protein P1T08_12800 [Acidimicrobiia bacterium]|nr:hypothetical protein [Acidimicrobiia bacterium]
MALCDQSDIEALLQSSIVSDPNNWVAKLIQLAQGGIEAAVGTPLDEANYVDTLDGPDFRSSLWLPHWPVTAVTSLVEDGIALVENTDFVLKHGGKKGEVVRLSGGYHTFWTVKPQSIVVTYTAGFTTVADVPDGLRGLCAVVVSRMFLAAAAFAANDNLGVRQESIGSYSVTYTDVTKDVAAAGRLIDHDLTVARRYGRHRSTVPIQ